VSSRIRTAAIALVTAGAVLASGAALVRASTDDSTTTLAPPDTTIDAPTTLSQPAPVKPSRIKLPRRKVSIAYARVVLDEQQAYFYNSNRKLIAKLPVSTGLDSTTPVGRFKVFSRSAQTFYLPRPQEKMKFMTRFTVGREGGNIGFHGIPYVVTKKGNVRFPTPLGIAPSSHGCIRMLDSHAQWVFENLPQGATVSVVESRR
jgi:lipoprotein-anchoring transpeptidase ErfK/SrfK